LLKALVVVAALGAILALWLIHTPARHVPAVPPIDEYVYLDQGWGKEREAATRQAYYTTPQGTSLKDLRYDWLVHLEMPWGTKRLSLRASSRAG
jgi:hypothetical protein